MKDHSLLVIALEKCKFRHKYVKAAVLNEAFCKRDLADQVTPVGG